MYQGNCNLRGENLLGKCFCMPGYSGKECEIQGSPVDCTNRDDKCFYSQDAGVFAISISRWQIAQEAEKRTWNKVGDTLGDGMGDRTAEHMTDFAEYKPVGEDGTNLGKVLEVGTGPWPPSYWMLKRRKFDVEVREGWGWGRGGECRHPSPSIAIHRCWSLQRPAHNSPLRKPPNPAHQPENCRAGPWSR